MCRSPMLRVLQLLLLIVPCADAQRWQYVGLSNEWVTAIAVDHRNSMNIYVGTLNGLYKSSDGGVNWRLVDTNRVGALVIHPDTTSILYATASSLFTPAIIKTTDGGESWLNATGNIRFISPESPYALAIDSTNGSVLYMNTVGLGSGRFFKTTNGGLIWTQKNDSVFVWYEAAAIAIDNMRPQIIYIPTYGGVFKSTNGGDSWRNMGLGNYGIAGFAFSVDPTYHDYLYYGLVQQPGFFKSTNAGRDWIQSNRGLTTTRLRSVAVATVPKHQVFLGTVDRGVFRSTDRGESWSEFSQGLPLQGIATLVYDLQTNTLYAGREHDPSAMGGVYSVKLRPASVSLKDDDAGSRPHVKVYPNPFNSSFVLEYTLPKPDHAKIEITDVIGRVLWQFSTGAQSAGRSVISLSGENVSPQVASGVLFAKLTSRGHISITRIVHIK